jgi:DNA-binding transcriptional MerR regulator
MVQQVLVDDLAHAAGTTTRNVRALQTAGVLLRPTINGRTADYGEEHLERLVTVIRLQNDGFSIASLRHLFDALEAGRSLATVLGVTQARPTGRQEYDDLDGWRPKGRNGEVRLLSVVPTNLLDAV